ncbi:MAG: proline dehydrogenase family protein, partial [Fidelibacterota bacterium]
LDLYDIIHGEGLDSTISLKLTHLGLGSDDALARRSLLDLLGKAKEKDNFLRIDMENSPYTDATISLYRQCALRYEGVGLVLQAYLKRTASDMASLLNDRLNVRICKGIYKETPDLAFQDPEEIRLNFIQLVQTALDGGAYVGIATHDRYLIDSLETWIMNKNIPEDRYEFQVLYGVPMKDRLEALLSKGNKVRVYVPYGEEWYQYATRRLQESPKIAGYILKNLFRKN